MAEVQKTQEQFSAKPSMAIKKGKEPKLLPFHRDHSGANKLTPEVVGRLSSQSCFSLRNNSSKCYLIIYSQIGQNTTIQYDCSFFQASNQLAVRQAFSTRRSIDTSNPQSAEVTLLNATVAVSVLTSFDNSLFGNTECTRTCTVITFSCF